MASSGNFSLWSPLFKNTTSNYNNLSKANTRFDGNTNNSTILTDFAIPVGTKFYAEMLIEIQTGIYSIWGIAPPTVTTDSYARTQSNIYGMELRTQSGSLWTVNSVSNTTIGSDSSDVGQTANRVIGVAVNRVDDELKLYLDNTLKFTLSIPSTGEYHFFASHTGASGFTQTHHNFNGGHDSTGAGDFSAGGNADANGFGDFQYSPPSGHLACCSANLPISADIDPAGDDGETENPTKQFGPVLYTGNGGSNAVTGLGFQPDLVWAKSRSSAQNHVLIDSSRGQGLLFSSLTNAEQTSNGPFMTSYDSDGFTYSSSGSNPNDSGQNYVAWCWRANGGTTSTDTSGDISTVRQSNTKGGFAILTWTGNGSNNQRLPHGLGKKPSLVIAKRRDAVQSWGVWTQHLGANSKELQLNSSSGWQASSNAWYELGMTTDFVGIGSDRNISSSTNVAYVWTEIEGYSKFGLFEGNSNADGPFVYTGFRPRLVFCKAIDASENWQVRDTARSTFNADSQVRIYWNTSGAEGSASTASPIDFLSTGFKVRGSNSEINSNTIIYGAWADVPAKFNNTF